MLTMSVVLYFETANSNCLLLLTIKNCALDQNFAFQLLFSGFKVPFVLFPN